MTKLATLGTGDVTAQGFRAGGGRSQIAVRFGGK
jgi:hypothetical protein